MYILEWKVRSHWGDAGPPRQYPSGPEHFHSAPQCHGCRDSTRPGWRGKNPCRPEQLWRAPPQRCPQCAGRPYSSEELSRTRRRGSSSGSCTSSPPGASSASAALSRRSRRSLAFADRRALAPFLPFPAPLPLTSPWPLAWRPLRPALPPAAHPPRPRAPLHRGCHPLGRGWGPARCPQLGACQPCHPSWLRGPCHW